MYLLQATQRTGSRIVTRLPNRGMVVRSVAGVLTGPGWCSLSKRKTVEIWSGRLLHLVPKIEWRRTSTLAHTFLACTESVLGFTLLRRLRNGSWEHCCGCQYCRYTWWSRVEDVEFGTKMHRWSVAESLLGSDYPQLTVLRLHVKAGTSHSGTKNVPRLLWIAKNVCSRRPATVPYLEPNEWCSPYLPDTVRCIPRGTVPSAPVFGTDILYVYLIA